MVVRHKNWFRVGFVLVGGLFAILVFTGVTRSETPTDPEEEFFEEGEVYEPDSGAPMSEMPMMPGMAHMMSGLGFGPPCMRGMMVGPGMASPEMGMRGRRAMPGHPGGMMGMMPGGPPEEDGQGKPHGEMQTQMYALSRLVFHLLTHPLHHPEGFGLKDEERRALVGLREKYLYRAMEEQKALEAAQFAFRDILSQPDFSAEKAKEYAKKVSALESELRNLVIEVSDGVRKLLGPERYAKLLRGGGRKPPMQGMMMRHRKGPPHQSPEPHDDHPPAPPPR